MTRTHSAMLTFTNDRSVALKSIPTLPFSEFAQVIQTAVDADQRVSAFFGVATRKPEITELYAILADDQQSQLSVCRTEIAGDRFPSLTPACPQVHLFEREIAEQFGLLPEGHPWLKPVRYQHSWTHRDAWGRGEKAVILPAVGDFFRVEGNQVHEVSVGPVHAGVIEPGHFRFQCHGEQVFHLEIALGFQHRGVEEALFGGPTTRSLHYAETLAGDSTVAHAASYCRIQEALAKGKNQVPIRAQVIRGVALELERLANHTGDLGALSGDTGFLPTASFCGRIRGDFLNLSALICGNRFGRGLLRPGWVTFDLEDSRIAQLLQRLKTAERETTQAVNLLWDTTSVMARFEDVGHVPKAMAVKLGLVGPAARASGLTRDTRYNQPSGIFRFSHIPVSTYDSGDVFGRAFVRWLEIQQSITFIQEQLRTIPTGPVRVALKPLAPESLAVSLTEGWRGEVCHVAITDEQGAFTRYKVVDPSFHNWAGLAYAMHDQEISDFPICNKSFNLSYCGHDL